MAIKYLVKVATIGSTTTVILVSQVAPICSDCFETIIVTTHSFIVEPSYSTFATSSEHRMDFKFIKLDNFQLFDYSLGRWDSGYTFDQVNYSSYCQKTEYFIKGIITNLSSQSIAIAFAIKFI